MAHLILNDLDQRASLALAGVWAGNSNPHPQTAPGQCALNQAKLWLPSPTLSWHILLCQPSWPLNEALVPPPMTTFLPLITVELIQSQGCGLIQSQSFEDYA